MATATKNDDRKVITFSYDGKNIKCFSRPIRFDLRKSIRKIQGRHSEDATRIMATLPEEMLYNDPSINARGAQKLIAEKGEAGLDEMIRSTQAIAEDSDVMYFELAREIIDKERFPENDPLGDIIKGEVRDEEGEVIEFWAVQDWEELVAFVDHFRKDVRN